MFSALVRLYYNIAQEYSLHWEIVPLIICYIKLNVQDEKSMKQTGDDKFSSDLWLPSSSSPCVL